MPVRITNPSIHIVLLYLIFALTWIFCSDITLTLVLGDQLQNTLGQTLKGVVFVLVTSGLLNIVLWQEFQKRAAIQQQYYALFDANPLPIALYNKTTQQIIAANQALQILYGYSPEEIIQHPIKNLYRQLGTEMHGQHKNGELFPVEIRFSDLYMENNTLALFVVIDLRERRHLEEVEQEAYHLEEALTKERELREVKNRFISMFAHDFRTPLAVIMNSTSILQTYEDRLSPEDRQAKYARILQHVQKIRQMLEEVMTLNRSDMGRVEFKPMPIDLEQFCGEILDVFRAEIEQGRVIALKLQNTGGTVLADKSLLHYVLTNLLSNALKYSPADKPVEWRVTLEKQAIIFVIQDYGIGIPPAEQGQLFNPFYRASNAKPILGTGLGLVIVREYVTLHGGQITFESTEGEGSTFTVTIPRT